MSDTIKKIIAQYGVPNKHGKVLTPDGAVDLYHRLQPYIKNKTPIPGIPAYRLVEVIIEGDRTCGTVYGIFGLIEEKDTNADQHS